MTMNEQFLRSNGIIVINGKIPKSQVKAAVALIAANETDAGLKDWIAGVGMSLVALLSSLDASASAKDVNDYLGVVEEKIEKSFSKDPKLKGELGLTKSFKSIGNGGQGEFTIKVGPYEIEGKYHELSGSNKVMGFKSKIFVDSKASEEQKKSWGDVAKKINNGLKTAFDS